MGMILVTPSVAVFVWAVVGRFEAARIASDAGG